MLQWVDKVLLLNTSFQDIWLKDCTKSLPHKDVMYNTKWLQMLLFLYKPLAHSEQLLRHEGILMVIGSSVPQKLLIL